MKKPRRQLTSAGLTKRLCSILNELNGGDFEARLEEISEKRNRNSPPVDGLISLNSSCTQLLIETIEKLRDEVKRYEKATGNETYF